MLRMLLISTAVIASSIAAKAGAPEVRGPVRLAQACGWYAIMHCGSADSARGYQRRTGAGFIINTTSANFPNFQPGYFCVVQGPAPRSDAMILAQQWRASGYSPTAYAKSAC